MNFEWSNEQRALYDATLEFARSELPAVAPGTEPSFTREAWKRCASFGVQGSYVPKPLGGEGRDIVSTIAMGEEDDDFTRSSIAVAHGKLFIRTNSKLFCIGAAQAVTEKSR